MGLYLTYKLEDQNREKLYEGQIKSFILNKEDETYVKNLLTVLGRRILIIVLPSYIKDGIK